MGRYYEGDISGKFWFGVQNSDDALFFGGEELEHTDRDYYFSHDDDETLEAGLRACNEKLGAHGATLDAYFATHTSYSDANLADVLAVTSKELADILTWYARHRLGVKIRDEVARRGSCQFTAGF